MGDRLGIFEVRGEHVTVLLQGDDVRMQVPLGDPRVGVPGDLLESMQGHAGVGEPGEPGMAQIVVA